MSYEVENTITYRITAKNDSGVEAAATTVTIQITNDATEADVVAETSILSNKEGTGTYYYQWTPNTSGTFRVTMRYTVGSSTRSDSLLETIASHKDAARW